jgi:radical S-adenosyl methionine domain-containing protein 2
MEKKTLIPAVNFHITKKCNMKCKYCFAEFKQVNSKINIVEQKSIIKLLFDAGFRKINFVGGEPLLESYLIELIIYAKNVGFFVSIVTNGSLISESFIEYTKQHLDIIGLSVDSLVSSVNKKIGRVTNRLLPDENYYLKLCDTIKSREIQLKINTVVSRFNLFEQFDSFIIKANPIRWKVFQVLEVYGENDINQMKISESEFNDFINRHINSKQYIISENNNIIKGSYIMIDPLGRFFDNTKGRYTISESINKIGVLKALGQINYDNEKFFKRNGNYYENYIKTLAL